MDSIFKFLIGIIPNNYKPMIVPVVITFPLLYAFLFITTDTFSAIPLFDRTMIAVSGSIIEVFVCFMLYMFTTIAGRWKYDNYRPVRFETYCLITIIIPFIGCAFMYITDFQKNVVWTVIDAINWGVFWFVSVGFFTSMVSFKFSIERSKEESTKNDETQPNDM